MLPAPKACCMLQGLAAQLARPSWECVADDPHTHGASTVTRDEHLTHAAPLTAKTVHINGLHCIYVSRRTHRASVDSTSKPTGSTQHSAPSTWSLLCYYSCCIIVVLGSPVPSLASKPVRQITALLQATACQLNRSLLLNLSTSPVPALLCLHLQLVWLTKLEAGPLTCSSRRPASPPPRRGQQQPPG